MTTFTLPTPRSPDMPKPLTLSEVVALPVGAIVRWEHDDKTYTATKIGADNWIGYGSGEPPGWHDDPGMMEGPSPSLVLADPLSAPDLLAAAEAAIAVLPTSGSGDYARVGELLRLAVAKAKGGAS